MLTEEFMETQGYLRDNEILIRSLRNADPLCEAVLERWEAAERKPGDPIVRAALVEAVQRLREHRKRQEKRK